MPATQGIVYQRYQGTCICICCSLALRDQSHAAEEGRKDGPCSILQLLYLPQGPAASGCPSGHFQAWFYCLCCWMMNLHEWTLFSTFIYIHVVHSLSASFWCLETGSHSVAQAGFEVTASASGALGFHFAYTFLLLASQNLQKVVHSVGS